MKYFKSLTLAIFGTAIAFGLSACGDDGTTEQIVNNYSSSTTVDTKDDLPECTDIIAGQTAFVRKSGEFYGCNGDKWLQLGSNTVSVGDNVCTSKELEDEDGYDIICNGKSIGVVRNGADGADGQDGEKGEKGDKGATGATGAKGEKGDAGDNGTGCKIVTSSELTVTISCGAETFTMDLSGYKPAEGDDDCDPAKSEDCAEAMENVELGGTSQKGPFVTGADVTAYELLNGRTLKQTGKTFGGKIENEDGSFNIKSVKLSSQYAYLVADGYYRNEVTGKNSASAIKLRALTNLKGRQKANINLVTHLEYDRVSYLVTKQGMSVANAKKQAEQEIFAAFNIKSENFKGYAEDYNVLEEGDGNAALLAISILLQSDYTEAQLTALLASLSIDLGDDGIWGNLADRAKIADWAMEQDLAGNMATFRSNVEGWGLTQTSVPQFETYFRNFWQREQNITECNEQSNGTVINVSNRYSDYYAKEALYHNENDKSTTRLICDAGNWRFAKKMEIDTVGFQRPTAQQRYAVYPGHVNTNLVYVYDGRWRMGQALDLDDSLGICTSFKAARNTITQASASNDLAWYRCVNDLNLDIEGEKVTIGWRKAIGSEADTVGYDRIPGRVVPGHANPSIYYYYEMSKGWRLATDTEKDLYDFDKDSVKTCDSLGRIWNGPFTGNYYVCDDIKKNVWDYERDWRLATSALEYSSPLGACTADRSHNRFGGEVLGLDSANQIFYRCNEQQGWILVEDIVYDTYGQSCNPKGEAIRGNINKDTLYTCQSGGVFRKLTAPERWARSVTHSNSINKRYCWDDSDESILWNFVISVDSIRSTWSCKDRSYMWDGNVRVDDLTVSDQSGTVFHSVVSIATQVWLAENVKHIGGSVCYDNDENNCNVYGGLFTYEEAKEVCETLTYSPQRENFPKKYHLPSDEEWTALAKNVGEHEKVEYRMEYEMSLANDVGPFLKATTSWSYGNSNDRYQFRVLPAGHQSTDESFNSIKTNADFWTADKHIVNFSGNPDVWIFGSSGIQRASVRCVSDYSIPYPPKYKE